MLQPIGHDGITSVPEASTKNISAPRNCYFAVRMMNRMIRHTGRTQDDNRLLQLLPNSTLEKKKNCHK